MFLNLVIQKKLLSIDLIVSEVLNFKKSILLILVVFKKKMVLLKNFNFIKSKYITNSISYLFNLLKNILFKYYYYFTCYKNIKNQIYK